MALAFAGPLCRFYAGAAADAARLQPGVLRWQRDLLAALGDRPQLPLAWAEDAAGEVLQLDLGAAGLLALRLFCCYVERPELELPERVPALLELDPPWRAAAAADFAGSRLAQVQAAGLWLPGAFAFTLRAPLPDGEAAEIGSVGALREQLQRLNQRSFRADAEEVAAWQQLPAPAGGDLLDAARRGLAGLSAAAAFAAARRLPLAVRER